MYSVTIEIVVLSETRICFPERPRTADSSLGMTIPQKYVDNNSTPRLRPRMMFRIHALQSIERDVGVDLRSRDVGMAQNRLYSPQIGAVFHHMCCARVPQHVWAGIASRGQRCLADHLPDPLTRQSPRSRPQEKKGQTFFLCKHFPATLQILL